ncbi:MAG: hypothetical protein HFI45_01090 [Lachnospiraceae bacterium]|nr:hypothetical protein [Lachnospiraceae bacterium]
MNRVNSYGAYQNSYYEGTIQNRKEQEKKVEAVKKNEEAKSSKQPVLSSRAKQLLKELQKTYGNMEFMVGSYETEEEAKSYLSGGTKEYSVLIDPEELEKMASDESVKKKYLGMLEDATKKLTDMKAQLGSREDEVVHMGVSIGKDGTMSFFADLEKLSEKQRERIEEKREERREEKASSDKIKRTRVHADSADELLKKIKQVDWSKIKEEKASETVRKFDFSV